MIRASVISLYLQLFPVRPFRMACYAALALNMAFLISMVIADCLICQPIAYRWDYTIKDGHCGNQKPFDLFVAVVNLLLDALAVVFPMPILWGLQMATGRKIALSGIFGMGIAYDRLPTICPPAPWRLSEAHTLTFLILMQNLCRDHLSRAGNSDHRQAGRPQHERCIFPYPIIDLAGSTPWRHQRLYANSQTRLRPVVGLATRERKIDIRSVHVRLRSLENAYKSPVETFLPEAARAPECVERRTALVRHARREAQGSSASHAKSGPRAGDAGSRDHRAQRCRRGEYGERPVDTMESRMIEGGHQLMVMEATLFCQKNQPNVILYQTIYIYKPRFETGDVVVANSGTDYKRLKTKNINFENGTTCKQ